jgi:acylphosphatase
MPEAETEILGLHAIVDGSVQGVGFRYFVRNEAQSLGLTGWVRNLWDDTVEVYAEGERAHLKLLLKALYRGPSAATVTGVNYEWKAASGDFKSFHIRLTSV